MWFIAVSAQVLNTVQGLCQRAVDAFKIVATSLMLPNAFNFSVSRSTAFRAAWPSCVLPKGEMENVTPTTCNQFFHIILHLMNKPKSRDGLGFSFLKGSMLLIAFFAFALGTQTANAQSSFTTAGTATKVATANGTNSSVIGVIDQSTLINVGAVAKQLASQTGGTPAEQADRAVKSQYYMMFSKLVVDGHSAAIAYDRISTAEINKLIANQPAGSSTTSSSVRQSLLQLLTQ